MICKTCKEDKPEDEFNICRTSKSGRQSSCRACKKAYSKQWRTQNKDRCLDYGRKYYQEHAESMKQYHREWNEKNPERVLETAKKNYWKNPKRWNSLNTINTLKRLQTDPNFKLRHTLRTRLRSVLKGKTKIGSFVRDIGCSVEELREYIETKFQPGMTWENHGFGAGKWHLDHIMPLSAFNLQNRQHFLLAANYLNLQPLWEEDNMKKNKKIPQQILEIAA